MQTQTAEEDYGEDIVSTLTAPGERKLSANPYAVNHCSAKQTDTTEFVHLLALASAIETMPGCFGALRKIKGELANGRAGLARSLWRRIMTRPDLSGDGGTAFDRFRDELKVILGTDPSTIDVPNHGALFDALALVDCKALAITSDPTPNEVAQEQAA